MVSALCELAMFLTGDGMVWLVTTFGNLLLLVIVLFLICMVVKFMYQD
ncbi:hypothetical protein [Dyadobacter sp. CY323]|nr:hypothetical protein [Dyadobacter sp. CY323]MCE6990010.1 hypothetical protein [Dyadobacter sp. CY323]